MWRWRLNSNQQLGALAKELGVRQPASGKKGEHVAEFVKKIPPPGAVKPKGIGYPKELARIKRPKGVWGS
jgi:hypothetical protein